MLNTHEPRLARVGGHTVNLDRPLWVRLLAACVVGLLAGCNSYPADEAGQTEGVSENAPPALSGTTDTAAGTPAIGAATDNPFADLSADTLIPPAEPALRISSTPGTLSFHWTALRSQQRARLYRFDTLTRVETLEHETFAPDANAVQLQSRTHLRAWHRQLFRIELCSPVDCVSSQRLSALQQAAGTLTKLVPSVYRLGEQYAEQLALNRDASLIIASLPVEGALDLYLRVGNQFTRGQRHHLNDESSESSVRAVSVALSDSGDTLAALVVHSDSAVTVHEIRILERLGEAWLETSRWSVAREEPDWNGAATDQPTLDLQISGDGTSIHLQLADELFTYRQSPAHEWQQDSRLPAASIDAGLTATTGAVSPPRLVDTAANATHSRLFTLMQHDQALWLGAWALAASREKYERVGIIALHGFDASAPLALHSTASGDAVLVGGVQSDTLAQRTPIARRFALWSDAIEDAAGTVYSLVELDSVRGFSTEDSSASLVFAANDSLDTLALGWHTLTDHPHSVWATYLFDAQSKRWLPALELRTALTNLAATAATGQPLISSDGSTLVLATGTPVTTSTDSGPSTPTVGGILALR